MILSDLVILNKQDNSNSSPKTRVCFSLKAIWETDIIDVLDDWKLVLDGEVEVTQVGTSISGNETLTNVNNVVQGGLGENTLENHFTEPSQISNEIQEWTEIMDQRNN